eukprot:gene13372-14746_t
MAAEGEQPVNQLVSTILDNVLDLSSVLAVRSNSSSAQTATHGAARPSQTFALPNTTSTSLDESVVESEVQRIFAGNSSNVHRSARQSTSGQLRLTSSGPNICRTTVSRPSFRPQQAAQYSSHTTTFARSNPRTLGYSFSRPSKGSRAQSAKNKGPFTVDMLLLSNPTMDIVPKQTPKVELIEKGYFLIGAEFRKEWTPSEINQKIREMFGLLLPDNIGITLCTSINSKIVKPTLAAGQAFDGFLVHRIFKNKTLYLRPDTVLLDLGEAPPHKKYFVDACDVDEESNDDFPVFSPDTYSVPSSKPFLTEFANSSSQNDKKIFASLSDELEELAKPLFSSIDENDSLTAIVRRRRIWDDSVSKILLFEEEKLKKLNVHFVGEMGSDYGGPTREFFTILLKEAPILSGVENSHDIPDFEIRKTVLKLVECNSTESINMMSDVLDDIRIDAGYNKPVIGIQERDMIVQKICKHNIITKQLEEIQQFMSGLKIFGVLNALNKYKEEATKELTYYSNLLTAEKIRSLFEIKYTEGASPEEKMNEEDIFYNFANLLDELENVELSKQNSWDVIVIPTEDDPEEVTKRNVKVTLEDVLLFLSGSRYLPTKGLRNGEITFSRDSLLRIHVNTCGLQIMFPLNERYIGSNFSENFCEDVLSSPGFGKV